MKLGTFSWRLLIGWSLILFGGLLSSLTVISVLLQVMIVFFIPLRPIYRSSPGAIAAGAFLQFVAGLIWLFAGRQILSKRVWWPLLAIVLGYFCGVVGAILLGPPG
jgi:hypothetical protein